MKTRLMIAMGLLSLLTINSCKKGCTDEYASNYNANKTKDNGSCDYYSSVQLNSIDIKSIPEYNSDGVFWDNGGTNDIDNDNTLPDLLVKFRAEGGYSYDPSYPFYGVQPSNVNKTQSLTPLSISDWEEKLFWVYFYEHDGWSHLELIDSVKVDPFNINDGDDRFKDTIVLVQGEIEFTANMSWN